MKRSIAHFSLAMLAQSALPGPSVSSFLSFDESFEFKIEDGCTYGARIRGTLNPVVSGPYAGQKVEPDLRISAELVCPQNETLRLEETLSNTGPITRDEVERLISSRASLTSEHEARRCTYVPSVQFVGEGMVGLGASAMCTLSRP